MHYPTLFIVMIHRVLLWNRCSLPSCIGVYAICCFFPSSVIAEDWPTFQLDNQRSGITSEHIDVPLHCQWVLTPRQKPHAAWEESPAKQDFWQGFKNLKPRSLFDRANYVSIAGNRIFFGSSSDDMICCRDLESGEERWVFFMEGPVRFAPTLYEGKVYSGSDDGSVYCLDAEDGKLIWKYNPFPNKHLIIGNGRMISACPIRTSILVQNRIVYFCAGIFPLEGVYLCALHTSDGSVLWQKTMSDSPQGYLLSTTENLFIPTGNTNPLVYGMESGSKLGSFSQGRSGGTYAIIVDNKIVSGPGYTESGSDWLNTFDTDSHARVASFQGNHVIVTDSFSYLHTDDRLTAIDRDRYFKANAREVELENRSKEIREKLKKLDKNTETMQMTSFIDELTTIQEEITRNVEEKNASVLWAVSCAHPYSLIATDTLLFAGGDNEVAAYQKSDGAILWKGEVTGQAYGLAVSERSLLVSTDQGTIHRFSEGSSVPKWQSY